MGSYPTKGAYWGANHVDESSVPAATKGAYYYGTDHIKKDIERDNAAKAAKAAEYDGATDEEAGDVGMSTLGSCITNTSNTTSNTEATVGSLGSDDSFVTTGTGAGTQEKTSGMTIADAGAGTRDKSVEELESTKTLKARGTQGGGGNGIFY